MSIVTSQAEERQSVAAPATAERPSVPVHTVTAYAVLFAISSVHLLNDAMQAVVTALFPVLEQALRLTFTQLGWLSFALNMTSSVMQPFVGLLSDKRPMPRMLPFGMLFTLGGLVGLALAPQFWALIAAVVAIGLGSAVFHPEGSRIVYYAAGARRSLAQSIYQVGGNAGSSLAPLMTMFIFAPLGQRGAMWAIVLAVLAIAVLTYVVPWYRTQLARAAEGRRQQDAAPSANSASADASSTVVAPAASRAAPAVSTIDRRTVVKGLTLLLVMALARSWYHAGLASYYQFFGMETYDLSIRSAQVPVFIFMAAGVVGTLAGGLLADRIGTRNMMLLSICGTVPFALLLPHLPLVWVYPVIGVIGFMLQSGFSVSVVYAQELLPGQVGMASGLIVGLAFGMGALGAVILGKAADLWGLVPVMVMLSYVLLLGLTGFGLPRTQEASR